ncbi:MAG: hypothetical protein ACJ8IR_00115 [Alphaproteobacteria bacterium]|jgi:hypothetical protein
MSNERSKSELLEAIRKEADTGKNAVDHYTGFIIPPFAELLMNLAEQAEASAKRLERLTKRLYWCTIAVLVLTFLLFAKEAAELYRGRQ